MRTKVLGPNQRIRIGRRELLDTNAVRVLSHVLNTVGLILEVQPDPDSKRHILLYAARRPATNDITVIATNPVTSETVSNSRGGT